MLDTLPFTLSGLRAAYAAGLDPRDVVAEVYRRIAAADDPGIFISLVPEDAARAAAGELGPWDPARPLWGIPFAVKDNIDARGMETTAGCPAFAYEADADAFAVAALREAGAILIGKTNLDQFAAGLVGVRTPWPVPRNALDPEIVPGGSSAGSAVAVARGLVTFALGTDTAGSGRVPAALNNIVGLKPSLGAISTTGVVPACRTLDAVSIFALTVEDAAEVLACAARFDAGDPYARPLAGPFLTPPPPVLRIGVPRAADLRFFGDAAAADGYETALQMLAREGAQLVPLPFSAFYETAEMLYRGAWVAERYAVIEDLLARDPDAVHPVTRGIIEGATSLSAADVFRDFYRLQALKRAAAETMRGVDMLCVPSIPTSYRVDEVLADPVALNSRLGTYTNFVNLLDMCGIAVPVAPLADGRPGSVTLLARAGHDAAVAGMAARLHARAGVSLGATGWTHPSDAAAPAATEAGLPPGHLAIAAVGAHMSGLPLNHELTGRGGRFLRTASTAPAYRLYALAGGPPKRPGLVRTGRGASIALEVWALPRESVGDFLAGIPSPLSIGTVNLADGTAVHGFLCESAGLDGAEDITPFGGWRSYCASLLEARRA